MKVGMHDGVSHGDHATPGDTRVLHSRPLRDSGSRLSDDHNVVQTPNTQHLVRIKLLSRLGLLADGCDGLQNIK